MTGPKIKIHPSKPAVPGVNKPVGSTPQSPVMQAERAPEQSAAELASATDLAEAVTSAAGGPEPAADPSLHSETPWRIEHVRDEFDSDLDELKVIQATPEALAHPQGNLVLATFNFASSREGLANAQLFLDAPAVLRERNVLREALSVESGRSQALARSEAEVHQRRTTLLKALAEIGAYPLEGEPCPDDSGYRQTWTDEIGREGLLKAFTEIVLKARRAVHEDGG